MTERGEERKLVRARPKAIEHLPEWAKCCQGLIDLSQSFGELVVDVSNFFLYPIKFCALCGTKLPPLIGVKVPGLGQCAIDWLDLDEGVLADDRRSC